MRDELLGWLTSRELCGVVSDAVMMCAPQVVQTWLARFVQRAHSEGLSLACVEHNANVSCMPPAQRDDERVLVVDACAFGRPSHVRLRISMSRARFEHDALLCKGRTWCSHSLKRHVAPTPGFMAPRALVRQIVTGAVHAARRIKQHRRWLLMQG